MYRNHAYIVPEKSIIEKNITDPYILPVQNVDKYGGGPGILHNLLINTGSRYFETHTISLHPDVTILFTYITYIFRFTPEMPV